MNFGEALELLKEGKKVARKGWNGKGMYIFLAGVTSWGHNTVLHEELTSAYDCIAMRTANSVVCFGWLASQVDMLAEDWVIVE